MNRILLVDDSRVTRELVKVFLVTSGMTLVEAADGQEAIEEIRAHRPDLVLADMRMPRLDGAALCEAIRADPATRGIPVVILTSSRDFETHRRARIAGASEILHKPVQPNELQWAIERQLARAAGGGGGTA